MIEIADLGAIVEQHSIALPIEPVCQQHAAFGARCHRAVGPFDLGSRPNPVADTQINLIGVRGRKAVWFPDRHIDHSARSRTSPARSWQCLEMPTV